MSGAAGLSEAQIVDAIAPVVIGLSEPCSRPERLNRTCDSTCNRIELWSGLHGSRPRNHWMGPLLPVVLDVLPRRSEEVETHHLAMGLHPRSD